MSMYHIDPGDVVDALREAGVDPMKVVFTPIFAEATLRCNSIKEIVDFCIKVFGTERK